jgi:hypothetical protein
MPPAKVKIVAEELPLAVPPSKTPGMPNRIDIHANMHV